MSEDLAKYGDYVFQPGVFGASDVYKLMGANGGINTDSAQTLILEKAAEQLTGLSNHTSSQAIDWGNLYEPEARLYYEYAFGCEVIKPAPQSPEWSEWVRVSADGIVDSKKGTEFKCPYNSANHLKHMLIRSAKDLYNVSKQYYWQVQQGLLIYEFEKWDFCSYDPRFVGNKRMIVVEIPRVEPDIIRLKENLMLAVAQKIEILQRIER